MAAGVAFSEDGVARGAMGVDAGGLRPLGPAAPAGRQLLEPDARPLSQRRHRAVRGRGADVDGWAREPAVRWRSACSSSTTTSTASSTSSPPTGTSKRRSAASSRRFNTRSRRCCSATSGKGKFENVGADVGAEFNRPMVARGAAYADIDHDGDLDVAVHHQPRSGVAVPQRRRQQEPFCACARWAPSRTATASARWCGSRARRASSGIRCAAAPATARRASWR